MSGFDLNVKEKSVIKNYGMGTPAGFHFKSLKCFSLNSSENETHQHV